MFLNHLLSEAGVQDSLNCALRIQEPENVDKHDVLGASPHLTLLFSVRVFKKRTGKQTKLPLPSSRAFFLPRDEKEEASYLPCWETKKQSEDKNKDCVPPSAPQEDSKRHLLKKKKLLGSVQWPSS